LLDERGIELRYRDYKKQPLSEAEIRGVLRLLKMGPKEVLRRNDKAFKELGLTGQESDSRLIGLMASHPTLLQRPIGVRGKRAVLGRPIEALLELA
jgi:arsenate reductase